MAKQRMQVGLSLGPSFAELCAIAPSGEQIFFAERIYRPKESLKNLFSRLKSQHPEAEFSSIAVSLRALEKIFPTRLGGSVAQIVTEGFESWTTLRQPLSSSHLSQKPVRTEALASQELIFPIAERVDSQGRIIKTLKADELQKLSAQLKKQKVEKLCLNLLFAHQNPEQQIRLQSFFENEGFEVFCSPRTENSVDEVPAWRKNILNACLAGSFAEIQREIKEASLALGPEISIQFLKANGQVLTDEKNEIVDSLFGWMNAFPQNKRVLHLGLEKWTLLKPELSHRWNSPWGGLEVMQRAHVDLSVQPTCMLSPDLFGNLKWNQEMGFEPGPMSFGRAQKPLVVDFLLSQNSDYKEQFGTLIQETGLKRFQESLRLLQKNQSAEHLLQNLVESLSLSLDSKGWILSGFWAPYFEKAFKKRFAKTAFEILPATNSEALYAAKSL